MKINGQNSIHQNKKQTYLSFGSYKNFRPIRLSEALESLKKSEIPQQVQLFLKKANPDANARLVDVHKDAYKQLLTAESLEEAKKLFPEFENVVEMTSLNPKRIKRGFVREVFEDQIENLSPKECTLKLLKMYYAKAMTWSQVGEQFGTTASAIQHLFRKLGINPLRSYYAKLISQTKSSFTQTRNKLSEIRKRTANAELINHLKRTKSDKRKELIVGAWNHAYKEVPEIKEIKSVSASIKDNYHELLKKSCEGSKERQEVLERFFNAFRSYLRDNSAKKLRKVNRTKTSAL